MSKGKTTTVVAFRLSDSLYFPIKEKAAKQKLSIGDYCKRVILKEALRTHHKRNSCSLCDKPLNGEQDPHQDCVNYEKYLADRH